MHIHPLENTSPTSYPRFEPHITLGSSPDLDLLRAAARTKHAPVPVRFKSVDVGPVYFRSIIVTIHPDDGINTLERNIRATLGKSEPPASYPHMSLFYIDDAEADEQIRVRKVVEERVRVRKVMEEDGIIRPNDQGVVLRCSPEGGEDDIDGFVGGEIWIVKCALTNRHHFVSAVLLSRLQVRGECRRLGGAGEGALRRIVYVLGTGTKTPK
jgi:2',3'-cyclic-nucleotide 3'-phosphodiesterase